MPDRILSVTAHTTFDFLDGEIDGHGFSEEAVAVLNVTAPDEDPEHVEVQLEMDNTDLDAVRAHADTVTLSPSEARELAAELEAHADRVEDTTGE
ncbi:MAG: DUF6360 family protein [Haloarculaceae archaeon]